MTDSRSERAARPLLTAIAVRLGQHTALYSSGFFAVLVLGIVNVAVLTRLIEPGPFGRLAVLLTFSAMLTIVYNLGSLQGTLRRVWGAGDDETYDGEGVGEEVDRPRALGTAVGLTTLIGLICTGAISLEAPEVARLLTGDSGDAWLVTLAAIGGALGSVWRLVSNIPRYERRPAAFAVLQNVRPLFVLGLAIPLVVGGWGIEGVLIGTSAGTAAAVLVGLAASWHSMRLAFDWGEARAIIVAGAPVMPLVVSFWVIQSADIWVLAHFASEDDVGIYRAASRIGALASYFVAAFLMSWTPLRGTSMFAAAEQLGGPIGFGSVMFTYFTFASLFLLVGLVAGVGVLVRILGPEYASAEPLIPLLALGFVAHGTYIVTYRTVRFARRRGAYVVVAILAAFVFIGAGALLTPPLGGYGTALAQVIAFAAASGVLLVLAWRGPHPLPVEWGNVLRAALAAALCIGATRAASGAGDAVGTLVNLAAIVAYPVLLHATGTMPRTHLQPLANVIRGLISPRRERAAATAGLERVSPEDRALLESLLRERRAPAEAAKDLGFTEVDLNRRFLNALRTATEREEPTEHEDELATYLLDSRSVAERDHEARRLWALGIDPYDIAELEATRDALSRLPDAAWRNGAAVPAPSSYS